MPRARMSLCEDAAARATHPRSSHMPQANIFEHPLATDKVDVLPFGGARATHDPAQL